MERKIRSYSYPNINCTKGRKFETWWRRWRRWLSFWDKTGGLNNASLQIRDRKLLLMQKILYFSPLNVTHSKECRGYIILNSRYFSRRQDPELVKILQKKVYKKLKVYYKFRIKKKKVIHCLQLATACRDLMHENFIYNKRYILRL